jgi:hypothetical protein
MTEEKKQEEKKKPKILVLVPMKVNLKPGIKELCMAQLEALDKGNPELDLTVIVDTRGQGDAHIWHNDVRVHHLAPIRNAIVADHLKDHDAILWIDADMVSYPANIATDLWELHDGGIAAPLILNAHSNQFYDTLGFTYKVGNRLYNANPKPHYFFHIRDQRPAYNVESVGCMYLINADIYRKGGKHEFVHKRQTDHYSLCLKAKELGLPIRVYEMLVARHAYLPQFGERVH